jgi:hypothetical protein
MGRSKGGSPGVFSKRGVSGPSSSTSHTTPAKTTPPPAASASTTKTPAKPATPTQQNAQQPGATGGPGLLGSLATTAVGTMVSSFQITELRYKKCYVCICFLNAIDALTKTNCFLCRLV